MKSSVPGSAQWRSSKRRTTSRSPAIRSKNVRQALKSSPAPTSGASPIPRRTGGPARPVALLALGDEAGHRRRDLRAGRRRVVGLDEVRPAPDHLAEGPEGHALAVRGRAALVPVDALDDAVDVLQELPGEAALADAALAGDRDEPDASLPRGRVEEVLEEPELRSRPTNGASRRSPRPRPPRSATTRRARHAGTGAALPLSSCSPAASKAIALDAARCVASPTRTAPGGATDWRPARRVDEVAGDHPLAEGAERDGGLAGQDAGAGGQARRPRPADGVDEVEARPGPRARHRPRARSGRPRRPSRHRR